MRLLVATALALAIAGCGKTIDLGAENSDAGGTTASGGGCTVDGECGAGQTCQNGHCAIPNPCSGTQTSCSSQGVNVCADSSCTGCGSLERCCVDNGFGQCQCFCATSCNGPSCAPAGTDPGPVGPGCSGDADCECGESCQNGICRANAAVTVCATAPDCEAVGGSCSGDQCLAGRCVPPGWQCQNDRECNAIGGNWVCASGTCACSPHSGELCSTDDDCSGCDGETCVQGRCGIRTTTGGTANGTTGATSSAGATTGTTGSSATIGTTGGTGTTGTFSTTAGSFGSTGSTASSTSTGTTTGTTGTSCVCNVDADCNDAFHEGYVCNNGFCALGPSGAIGSTGGVCASPSSSATSTGTSGST